MSIIWILSIIAVVVIAQNKCRNALGWFFLGFIFGPLALIVVLLLPKLKQGSRGIFEKYPGTALNSLKGELDGLRSEISALSNRLESLTAKLGSLEREGAVESPLPIAPATEEPQKPASPKSDIEMNLGKFWLNKIGMFVFSLGVAFLLTYTFTHLGPAAKILLGYLTAAALFIAGIKLEKSAKFVNYGRVLLGGGWAIAYFTTYAMYHFEASKIIHNQLLDLFLLALVALGIIAHSLRYRSEALTATALFIGYFTSVLGDVGSFTLASAALLAVVALVMVYKMQWTRFIFLGIVLTYATHFAWVIKQISFSRVPVGNLNVENVYFFFDAGFLAIYWLMFTAAIHLMKNNLTGTLHKRLAAANFANFILFFLMVYPKFHFFYPAHKFNALLGLGLVYLALAAVMEAAKKNEFFISDIIIAVAVLTMSVPVKFLPYHATLIWLIELPFLLFVGIAFERKVYRYLSFALLIALFLKFAFWDWRYPAPVLDFFVSWKAFLSFAGFLSTAVCYGLYRSLRKKGEISAFERAMQNFYSGISVIYLVIYSGKVINPLWLTLGFSCVSLLVFYAGAWLTDKYLRGYALAVLALAGLRFCFSGGYSAAGELQQLFLIYGPAACGFAEYFIYRGLERKSLLDGIERRLSIPLFYLSSLLVVVAIFRYIASMWITVVLGIAGVSLFVVGFLLKDRVFRHGGFIIFGLTLARVIFVDLAGLPIIYKIISFIVLGVLFLGVSFVYTKFNLEKITDEKIPKK